MTEKPKHMKYLEIIMLFILPSYIPMVCILFRFGIIDLDVLDLIWLVGAFLCIGSVQLHKRWVKKYNIKTFDEQTKEYNELLGFTE